MGKHEKYWQEAIELLKKHSKSECRVLMKDIKIKLKNLHTKPQTQELKNRDLGGKLIWKY